MKYTENYNLKKPEAEDFYNVEDFNENADIIDKKLKDLEDNFEKVATWFVGDMEPDIKLPMQVWVDTHEGVIKQRNLGNTGWIVRAPVSGSWGVPVGTIITLAGLPV